jgi:3-oxoacyl-[acyl-carrier protein] reductase
MSRTIVVTGGGRGIGKAIALAFAEPGAHIIITSRTQSQLDATAAAIAARGARATAIAMDVSDEASVAQGFGSLHGHAAHVNVLVNNAGVGGGEVVQGSDVARWKKTLDTNLFGMYLVTRQILPLMADNGRVINLSSGSDASACLATPRTARPSMA